MSKNKIGDGPGRGDHLRRGIASGKKLRKKKEKPEEISQRNETQHQPESAGIRSGISGGG